MVENAVNSAILGIAERCKANQKSNDSDFKNEEGLLICGVCGDRKETFINLTSGDATHRVVVPCICKCRRAELENEDRERKHQEAMTRIGKLRTASFLDNRFEEARFNRFHKNKDNQVIFNRCWRYASAFDEMLAKNYGLLLWGDVGTGKSYVAACIANHLLDKGVPVMMTSFVKLLEICNEGSRESDIINRLHSAKLVIFDDLGAERGTDYALEKVYNIVDSRYRAKLPMILTTNQSLDDMMRETDIRYTRIYDRIFETCYPMQFTGVSWRKRKAFHQAKEIGAFLDTKE